MSSLKFCRGAKEEDDSQITDNTEMGRPNVLKIVSKNGLTGKILCFNLLIIEKNRKEHFLMFVAPLELTSNTLCMIIDFQEKPSKPLSMV